MAPGFPKGFCCSPGGHLMFALRATLEVASLGLFLAAVLVMAALAGGA